jgi:ABC-type transporter Mla maintaining outer membrane lipid asymmetry permease subunit MlaE
MLSISPETLLIIALVTFIVGMIVGISLSRPRIV